MNECEQIRGKLDEMLHNELCDAEAAPVRAHIAACPDCQSEEAALTRLTEAVKRACLEKAPVTLHEAIRAAIQEDGHYRNGT